MTSLTALLIACMWIAVFVLLAALQSNAMREAHYKAIRGRLNFENLNAETITGFNKQEGFAMPVARNGDCLSRQTAERHACVQTTLSQSHIGTERKPQSKAEAQSISPTAPAIGNPSFGAGSI